MHPISWRRYLPCWALVGQRGELLEVGSPVEVALMVERRGLEVER